MLDETSSELFYTCPFRNLDKPISYYALREVWLGEHQYYQRTCKYNWSDSRWRVEFGYYPWKFYIQSYPIYSLGKTPMMYNKQTTAVAAYWWEEDWRTQEHLQQPSASALSSRRCSRTGGWASWRGSWRADAGTCSRAPPRSAAHGSSWGTLQTLLGNPCTTPGHSFQRW